MVKEEPDEWSCVWWEHPWKRGQQHKQCTSEVVWSQISHLRDCLSRSSPFHAWFSIWSDLLFCLFCRNLELSHFLQDPPLAQVSKVESGFQKLFRRTGSLPHTWRRVSALANSPTVCVIRWGDNSSHLISSPNLLSNYLFSLCIH